MANPYDQFDANPYDKFTPKAKAKPKPKSTWDNIKDVGVNAAAGLAQGVAGYADLIYKAPMAIADAGSQAADFVVDKGLRAVGADGAADALNEGRERIGTYRPRPGIADAIERIAPTKKGYGASRFVYQVAGGAMAPNALAPTPRTLPTPKPATQGQQVAQAAQRQNIDVLPADVGGAMTRTVTAAAKQTPLGAGPIVNAANKSVASAGEASKRIAATAGQATDDFGAGEIGQRAAHAVVKKTSSLGGRLYKRAERLSEGAMVQATKAGQMVDDHIAELSQTPTTNAAAISIMQGLKDDLTNPLTVQAIRGIRTHIRAKIVKEGLRKTDFERRALEILDSASDDIGVALKSKPGAAAAYRTADKFWRARVEQIDEVLAPIIGKGKSEIDAFRAIERMAGKNGDPKKLARLMNAIPEDDAGSITATIIEKFGKAGDGAQNAAADVFSPATFLTNWTKMPARTKAVLFGHSPELRSALNDLATVTGGMKAAAKYANSSNSGGVVGTLATGALLTQSIAAPVLTASLLGLQYATGRLMASPAFVRWLAGTAKAAKHPGFTMRAAMPKLTAIASQNPSIAGEIKAFQRALNDNASVATSAAASEVQNSNQ